MVLKAVARWATNPSRCPQLLRARCGRLRNCWTTTPEELRMHMGLNALQGAAFDKTIEMHKVIGTPYLIVASLPHKSLASVQAIAETGKLFNDLSARLKPHGMQIAITATAVISRRWRAGPLGSGLAKALRPTSCCSWISAIASARWRRDRHAEEVPRPLGQPAHQGPRRKPGSCSARHGELEGSVPICETTGGTKLYIIEEKAGRAPGARGRPPRDPELPQDGK